VRGKLSLIALAMAVAGCEATECDIAVDAIVEKATECELPYADLIDEGRDNTCDDAEVAELERQAECTEAASCDALNGSDTAGNREFSECILAP
jgi:hypothetical protein